MKWQAAACVQQSGCAWHHLLPHSLQPGELLCRLSTLYSASILLGLVVQILQQRHCHLFAWSTVQVPQPIDVARRH